MNEGQIAKAEGMGKVDRGANPEWVAEAELAVGRVAREQYELIADDLLKYITTETHDHRALGPVMVRAERDGLIMPTDKFVNSGMRKNHDGPKRIWLSVIYEGRRKHG